MPDCHSYTNPARPPHLFCISQILVNPKNPYVALALKNATLSILSGLQTSD